MYKRQAGEGDTAYFKDLTVKNLRTPGRTFVEETPEKVASIFAEIPKEEGCFAVSGTQITKDPSREMCIRDRPQSPGLQ